MKDTADDCCGRGTNPEQRRNFEPMRSCLMRSCGAAVKMDIIALGVQQLLREPRSTLARRINELHGVSAAALRRTRLPVAMVIISFICVQPSAASPGDGGIQRLPVIEKQDIRFEAL